MNKSYWDHTERERAALTEKDVEALTALELMQKGVLRVQPLQLDPEPADPLPEPTMYFKASGRGQLDLGVCFETVEQTKAFIALKPLRLDHHYIGNDYSRFVEHTKPLENLEVTTVNAVSEAEFMKAKANLEKIAAVRKSNKEKQDAYDTDLKAQNEALEGLWSDWYECRQKDAKMRRVVDVFSDYERTAGDRNVAAKFLRKAFSESDIDAAQEWCGVDMRVYPEEMPEAPMVEELRP